MAIELGSAYGKVELNAQGVQKGVTQSRDALGQLEKSVNDVFKVGMGNLVAQGIGQLIRGMRELYGETRMLSTGFESQMAIMSTAVDPAVASIDTLHDAAIAVGGDISLVGIDAAQAADSMTGLFKAGLSVNDVFGDMQEYLDGTTELNGALRASVDLQAASALNLAESADLVSVSMATYGLEAEEATRISNNFVQAADASVAEVEDLAAGLKNAGPTAAALGISLEDTNNALAILSTRGIAGAEAGTALKSMLANLQRPTDAVQDTLAALNVTLYDSEGRFVGLSNLIAQFEAGVASLTDEQRNLAIQTVAGTYGMSAMNTLLAEGVAGWKSMAQATADAATAQEVAAARTNTLQGAQEALEGTLDTLKIQVGEEFIPVWLEMTQGLSAFYSEHGPQIVSAAGSIADAVLSILDALQNADPVLVNTALQMTGLVAALGSGYFAVTKLAPVVASLGPVLSEAVVGMQLYAGGATTAEIASLGWSAALGPIAIGLGAIVVALVAVNKAIELHKQIEQKTTEVADQWRQKLDEIAAKSTSAAAVVEAYATQQAEVADIYESSSAAAQLFIDDIAILNARSEDLNSTLIASASSYDDYRGAVDQVNATVEESSYYINGLGMRVQDTGIIAEHSIEPINALAFAIQRGEVGANESAEMFDQYSQALLESEKAAAAAAASNKQLVASTEKVGLSAEESANLYDQLKASLEGFGMSQADLTRAQDELGVRMGYASNLANMQANAINLLGYEYAQGNLTMREYIAAGERIKLVNEDSLEGYQDVMGVVQEATGKYRAMGAAASDLPSTMYDLQNAAREAAAAQEEMATRAQAAWETFAGNVRNGVAAALDAYKAGNADMLAEQQRALAEMLWTQTDQMVALGQISGDQALEMKSAIADEFGIVVDEVELTTSALLTMFSDWAAGGQTSADQIVTFIQNIGTESATLATNAEANIAQQLTAWENLSTGADTAGMSVINRAQELGMEVDAQGHVVETAFGDSGSAATGMAGDVEGASARAVSAIEGISNAISDLPDYKRIEIEIRKTGDDAFDYGSPQFRFYYSLQDLVNYAKDHPVEVGIASKMDGGMALSAPTMGSLAPLTAPTNGGYGGNSYDHRRWDLNMPITVLGDELDAELLAQRVLSLIRSRQ